LRLLRSGAVYAVANLASAAMPFLLLPLLTRVLGPAQYGSVVGFMLLVTVCQTVAGLSMNAAVGVAWFKRSAEEMRDYTTSALIVAAASTAVAAAAGASALWHWPALVEGVTPAWGALAALTAGANIVLQCRLVLWQARQRAVACALLQFAVSGVNVALSLLAVLVFAWGGQGRNAGVAAAYVLAGLAAVTLLAREGELGSTPRVEHLRHQLHFAAPLVLHALAGALLATADRWVVAVRLDAASLGLYGAGAQLGMVMAMLADAFVKAFTPWLYDQLRSTDAEQRRLAVAGAVYAVLPGFLLLALAVGAVLHVTSGLLLGPRYAAAAQVLPWFMLGGAFGGLYMCGSALLYFESRTGRLASMTSLSALVGTACTWVLVGRLGLGGAAVGYAFTQGLLALVTLWMAMRSVDLPWQHPMPALAAWLRAALRHDGGAERPPAPPLEPRKTTP
jgi:O-antigen/teichoic acid export membrane protein